MLEAGPGEAGTKGERARLVEHPRHATLCKLGAHHGRVAQVVSSREPDSCEQTCNIELGYCRVAGMLGHMAGKSW